MKNKFISRQSNEIVVTKQIQPSTLSIKGVAFQFIYHNTGHFFWAKKIWVNSFNKVTCSDLEKAIIDNNEHEDGGINFYISFIGRLGGLSANKRVKVDISRSEKLVFDPVLKPALLRGRGKFYEHKVLQTGLSSKMYLEEVTNEVTNLKKVNIKFGYLHSRQSNDVE